MALTSLAYGFVLRDWWLAAPNLTSFPLGILYSLILLRSLPPKKSLNFAVLLTILSFISAFWSAVALIHLGQGTAMASLIQGIGVTLAIGFMYIAPLSTLLLVLRTRSAESIYIPVSIATLFNSLFWMGYGVFIGSGFIWGPNCVGAVSAGLQILLKLMFRGKRVEELVVGEAELGEAGKESKDDVADKDANV